MCSPGASLSQTPVGDGQWHHTRRHTYETRWKFSAALKLKNNVLTRKLYSSVVGSAVWTLLKKIYYKFIGAWYGSFGVNALLERKLKVQKWDAPEDFWASHTEIMLRRSYHHYEKTQIEMVWAHDKVNRTCKDDPTGHDTRRERERQTEKEMGRQHTDRKGRDQGWVKPFERLRTEGNGERWLPQWWFTLLDEWVREMLASSAYDHHIK